MSGGGGGGERERERVCACDLSSIVLFGSGVKI